MNDGLSAQIERGVPGWPGVSKETGGGGPGRNRSWVPPATIYGFGRRQLGHAYQNESGPANFSFPGEVRRELVRLGRAIPDPAFPDSRTDAGYQVRSTEDMPGTVDLFRINYKRAVARDARHAATRKEAT